MFLGLLFASIVYNTGACCNQKHKQKECYRKAVDRGMCWCANGKRHYLDGRVEDIICKKK